MTARRTAVVAAALFASAVVLAAQPAAAAEGDFFPSDDGTLAIFEFSGNVTDSSGNGRDATLLDANSVFAPSEYGTGLVLPGVGTGELQGFDWSAYKQLLVPPYTVEILLYPEDLSSYNRLFTNNGESDDGLYYTDGVIQNYPDAPLEGDPLSLDDVHCLAWSAPSSPANVLDLYLDGQYLGQVGRGYEEPDVAWFLQDNVAGGGTGENLSGYVDAMRISSVARTGTELAATCAAAGAGQSLIPAAAAPALPATGSTPETGTFSVLATAFLLGGASILLVAKRRRAAR